MIRSESRHSTDPGWIQAEEFANRSGAAVWAQKWRVYSRNDSSRLMYRA